MFDLLKAKDEGPTTFAAPGESTPLSVGLARSPILDPILHPEPYVDIFRAAERQTRLVDNMFASQRATEEAYDQRIAAVKATTGVDLENPLRGGYSIDARKRIRDEVRAGGMQPIDAKGGVPEYQARIFDEKLAELQQKYPDLPAGSLKADAQAIAKGADEGAAKANAADVNPITSFAFQIAGGMWAGRRDPLFLGSMFLGPTSAVGKTAIARVVTSGIFQGAYNAGVAAMEQPAVQAWRSQVGLRSGTEPALENVGMAFLFGMIPGAVLRGGQELIAKEATAARPAIERVLAGHPEPGDPATAVKAVGAGLEPHQEAAVHMGEEMQAADRATLPPVPKDVPPEIHDDMMAAALKRADDPEAPSPEAVAALNRPEEIDPELRQRIDAEQPKSIVEAQQIADEALDDLGRRQGMDVLRRQDSEAAARVSEQGGIAEPSIEKPAKDDPLGKVPFVDDGGRPKLMTESAVARIGERETNLAMLIRSCK